MIQSLYLTTTRLDHAGSGEMLSPGKLPEYSKSNIILLLSLVFRTSKLEDVWILTLAGRRWVVAKWKHSNKKGKPLLTLLVHVVIVIWRLIIIWLLFINSYGYANSYCGFNSSNTIASHYISIHQQHSTLLSYTHPID